jgi:hypothetical protein
MLKDLTKMRPPPADVVKTDLLVDQITAQKTEIEELKNKVKELEAKVPVSYYEWIFGK